MFGDGQDEPDSPSPHYEKTIFSTNAINKLIDPTSKFHALSHTSKKRKADARRKVDVKKEAALEKLPILTEENTTLKEEVAQLKAQIAAHEPPCRREQNLQRQLDAERAKTKIMQDENKSKKVDDFAQMKTMKAAVKESERKAEEEEKKRKKEEKKEEGREGKKVRRAECAGCDPKGGTFELEEHNSGEKSEERGKRADKKAGHGSRFAKGRSKRLGELQKGNDPQFEIVKEKGEAVGEPNCTHEPTTPTRVGEGK